VVKQRIFGCLFAFACVGHAAGTVSLQISNESAPAGGFAQIKIYAAKPTAIASGHIVVSMDRSVFYDNSVVGLFGANADASGVAMVTGGQIDIQFSSPSSGIGQLAGLPVIVITVPVMSAAAGRTAIVSATSPDSSVTVASGSVSIKGSLSVGLIPAGMGVAPAGTVLPVLGTGFTPATTVSIDGVAIASTKLVSAQEIDVTLGGSAELVGKVARVQDAGTEFDYFCFEPNDPGNLPTPVVQPLFPLLAMTSVRTTSGSVGGLIAIENPNDVAATVTYANVAECCGPPVAGPVNTITIPAGFWAELNGPARQTFAMKSSVRVRVVAMNLCPTGGTQAVCLSSIIPYDENALVGSIGPVLTPSALTLNLQRGSSVTRAITVTPVNSIVRLAAKVISGGDWLSVSSQSGSVSVAADSAKLASGSYQGSVEITQSYGPSTSPASVLPVALTVTDARVPLITATPSSVSLTAPAFNATPQTQTISVTSDSGPEPFTVSLPPGTWAKVSPLGGTTPATLSVTWDPAVTSQIYYQQRATPTSILISGPGNAVTISATFNVTGVQTFQTYLGESGTGPNGLVFSASSGSSPQTQIINVDPAGVISATTDQSWLNAVSSNSQTVTVTANPAGLADGAYQGNVTISEANVASKSVPVTLGVWSKAPALTITQNRFLFIQTLGQFTPATQTAEVDSGGVPVPFTISLGAPWLNVVDHYSAPTPAPLEVNIANAPQAPGQYEGSFTLESAGGSVYVPVTLLVQPGAAAPPVVSQVVNAASGIAGGVSPGEVISVRGYSAGSSAIGGLRLDPNGMLVPQVNGLTVTFDGQAAPLIYTSSNQTNVIVPYEVAGRKSTVMQVVYVTAAATLKTAAWGLPVNATVPGIFTSDATGTGQAAVVNQDGSRNSATNPATRGSVVSIYATGEGQTSPPGVTGSVAQSTATAPVATVTARIGGTAANVQYAGPSPGSIEGLLQVNAVVPDDIPSDPAVPVVVTIGGVPSQAGVTIAVR
jgi:uncharacterized protein (TIGR03437 family)